MLTVDEAPISYYEWTGTEWMWLQAPTGGLSFPPYFFSDRIPLEVRGIITLSSRLTGLFADVINVSHEGVGVCPTFEADGEDLMLYGSGERIPSGAEGRWHVERLLVSPFLYRLDGGTASFANAYEDGGVYRDRLYGDHVVPPPCLPPSP